MATKKSKKPSQQVDVGNMKAAATGDDAILNELVMWVNEADDNTKDSRALSEKSRDYYDSKQWTAEERTALAQRSQAATVINRIKPKMDGLMGLEKSNRTTVRSFPRTPKHEADATASTEAIRYVLENQSYLMKRSAAWENLLMEGTGGIEVIVKRKSSADPEIVLNHIPWDRIIYDPRSRRKDFSDARYLGQVIWMDYDDAIELYPDAKDILTTMQEGSQTYEDKPKWMEERKRCKIVELYYKKGDEVYYACFTRAGFCVAPKISGYKTVEGETEWPYEFGSLFVDRENNRYGACVQLLDIQDEINKRRSKALHLMSVRQIAVQRGAVEDVNKLRKELAKPDGVAELDMPIDESFQILKTGDMAQAQFNLLAEAKAEIDAVSYSAALGGKEMRNMSGKALQSREMAGQTENAPMFEVLRDLDYRVYRKIWNRIRQYWTGEKWVRVTDDKNNMKWVGLNRKITVGEQMLSRAKEQGAPPEAMQQIQMQIQADPAMQRLITENDIAQLDVDLILADAPDAISQQAEDFQTLGEMVKSGFPMPPIAVIEASPLYNKEKIIKMMKEQQQNQVPPQVQQQMQQMKEQTQQMQQQLQKLAQENQQLKQDISADMAKIQSESALRSKEIGNKQQLAEYEIMLDKQIDIDKALVKMQGMIQSHENKILKMLQQAIPDEEPEKDEVETTDGADKEAAVLMAVSQQHEAFMQAVGGLMESLNSKKNIKLVRGENGRIDGAEVTPITGGEQGAL